MNSKPVLVCLFLFVPVVFGQSTLKKVSRAEASAAVVSKVAPEYPPVARQLKMEGTVELEATVAEDGTVSQVNIVSGNPVLTKAGAEALKRWKFSPFKEDGKAVKVIAPISMSFHRGGEQ